MTGVGLRFVIAGLLLYAVAAVTGSLRAPRDVPWKLVFVLATFFFGLNYILTYTAETRLDSGLVAVLFGTLPFFVFALGHVMAGERTTPQIWTGALVAFVGVGVISISGQVRGSPLYALAAIGAAGVSSFGNVYAKKHSHHSPLLTLPPSMLIAGLCVGALGLATEHVDWTRALSLPSLEPLLYMAVFGSGAAFFLNLWVLHRLAAWIVGLSALIIPVIAVVVGIAFGGEVFTWRELGGSALVVAGIWIALRKNRNAAAPVSIDA
jgi:drug/metabolite transporter (DMT)-like permease